MWQSKSTTNLDHQNEEVFEDVDDDDNAPNVRGSRKKIARRAKAGKRTVHLRQGGVNVGNLAKRSAKKFKVCW